MRARAIPRRKASFAFTVGTVGIITLATGLMGFQLRGHYGPDTRPLGYWTGGLVWDQVVVGVVCIMLASVMFYSINRDLGPP